MSIFCEDCGHGIEIHSGFGCEYPPKSMWSNCDCTLSNDTVEARYWARRMMIERDVLQAVNELLMDANKTWHREYTELQSRLDIAVELLVTIRHNVFVEDTSDYHNFRKLIDDALAKIRKDG